MLVLTRKVGESIVIGDNIVIKVVQLTRNKVRIGIEAPKNVPIRRAELDKCPTKPVAQAISTKKLQQFKWVDSCFDQLQP